LKPFFKNMLTERTHARHEKQIIAHLLKLDNIQAHAHPVVLFFCAPHLAGRHADPPAPQMQEQLIRARAHQIKITENRECQFCHKRLGSTYAPSPSIKRRLLCPHALCCGG
jgi:hypothetical protein